MIDIEFRRDTVFTLSVAVVLMLLCFCVGITAVVGTITETEELMNCVTTVFNLWWLWMIIFALCLILPAVRMLISQAMQIKNKEPSLHTEGLEMAQTALMAVVVMFCYILPNITTYLLNANVQFLGMRIIGLVIPLIWIGLWIASVTVMFVADKKTLVNEETEIKNEDTSQS